MERNSDTPASSPDQDFMELNYRLLATQVTNRSNNHRIRHFVESDSVKRLVMFNGHDSNRRLNKTATKIVNFPHIARLATLFDPTRELGSRRNHGVVISSLNRHEIKSNHYKKIVNKRVAEESPKIEKNGEITNKKMKMKIDGENINVDPHDEHSRVIAGDQFDDYQPESVSGSNEDSDSGCSSEDVHEEMEVDERTVDNKRSRTTHHDHQRKRKKMQKKVLALQELLPGRNKEVDKASVLDEAIEYVKTLQRQLQVMSIAHLFTPTPKMIPSQTSQIIIPTLNQFSPQLASSGVYLGIGSGFGLGPVPISPQPGFAPMSCVMPYGPGLGEGAGANSLGRLGPTSFDHHQLGSSVPTLSNYNDTSKSEDMGTVPKPKHK